MTAYEQAQVARIKRWKLNEPGKVAGSLKTAGEFMRYVTRPLKIVTAPLSKALTTIISDKPVVVALGAANDLGKWLVDEKDILVRAGVNSLDRIGDLGLKASDRMAEQVRGWATGLAGMEGFATGSAGFLLMGVDIVVLISLSFRTIHKMGLCYGYRLEGTQGERFALCVLAAATADGPQKRATALSLVKKIESNLLEESIDGLIKRSARRYIAGRGLFFTGKGAAQHFGIHMGRGKLMQLAPLVGAAVGGVSNVIHMNKVGWAARRMFQERWLKDRGKI